MDSFFNFENYYKKLTRLKLMQRSFSQKNFHFDRHVQLSQPLKKTRKEFSKILTKQEEKFFLDTHSFKIWLAKMLQQKR